VTAGLIVCVAALVVATAGGLTWRRRNGRFRPVPVSQPARAGQDAARQRNSAPAGTAQGTAQAGTAQAGTAQAGTAPVGTAQAGPVPGAAGLPDISAAELGQPLGPRATLVQFSSAFCAPCRATRQVLAEVAGMTDGVAHVEIDAESHLELVRRLDVRRTPTVFVLGPDGRIARRASGQPRRADLIAALGEVT
jgi:thiol-disulfide isomerase/thioredoxin